MVFAEERGFSDRAAVAVGLVGYCAPLVAVVLVGLKQRRWRLETAGWRWRLWVAGFWMTAVASMMGPLLLLGVQTLSDDAKRNWFIRASGEGLAGGLLLAVLAVVPLGFGRGRLRWVMMVATVWTAAVLYVSAMAASY